MQGESTRWYSSAVDWWLGILLVAIPIVAAIALAVTILEGESVWGGIIGVLIVVAIYGGLVIPVRYGLAEDHLVVRFGLVRQRVMYGDIRRVHPTQNPLSSPALSLSRLCVDTGKGFAHRVRISPADRGDFLDALAGRTGLERTGDSLAPGQSREG